MSKEEREEQLTQLRLALQRKETEELLEIWKKNDTAQWTPEAFETIREILLERTGSLPGQDDKTAKGTQIVTDAAENIPDKPPLSMTKHGFVSLFLKMVAIYFLIRSIPSLLSVGDSLYRLRSFGYPESLYYILSSIFSLLVFCALMVVFIWKSDRLSGKFITKDEPLFPIGELSLEEIQSLAFSWVGVVTLISGVSGAVYNLAYFARIKYIIGAEQVKIPYVESSSQLASSLAEMLIGAILFLYPNGLVRLWHSMQRRPFAGKGGNEEDGRQNL